MATEQTDIFDAIADVVISRRAEWRQRAACVGAPITLFFPTLNRPSDLSQAKALCGRCPVIEDCREEWQSMPGPMRNHGVWWGTSDGDRRGRRRR